MTTTAISPTVAATPSPTGRSTPLTLLQVFIWLLAGLPARLVIGSIGSFGSPASIAGILAFGLWAVSAAKEGALARTVWPVRFGLLALWIPTLLSYAVMHLHSNPADEVNGADRAVLFLLVWTGAALLAAEGLRGLDELLRLFRTLAAAAAYVSAVAIAQTRLGFDLTVWLAKIPGLSVAGELDSVLSRSGFARPAGTATHPIELSCVLATMLGIAIVLAVFDHGWSPRLRWGTLAVMGIGIPLALSRSGIIGAVVVLVVWLAGAKRVHVVRTLWVSSGFVVLLFLSSPGLLGTLRNWFAGWNEDSSISTRTDDYPAVARYIRASPIIGRGPSTFLPKFRILDNQWLLQLIEVGIVGALGFAAYLLLPAFLGRSARHHRTDDLWRSMGQALAGASVVAMVSSASFDSFTFPMFPGLWAVLLGGAGLLWRESTPARPQPLRRRPPRRSQHGAFSRGHASTLAAATPEDGHSPVAAPVNARAHHALKWSFVAQLVTRGGAFAIGLILARLLVPEEYGTYTVALGLFTILLTIDDLGLRQGLVRHVGNSALADRTAATIAAGTGVVSYGVAFVLAPLVAEVTHTPRATDIIRVLCLGLLIDTLFHIVPSAALQRALRQDLFAVTEVGGLAIDFLLTIVLARQGFGAWSLVWGSLAGQAVRAVLCMVLTRSRPAWGFDREVARVLLSVSAPFALASLVGAALLNVDYLIVGHILGPAAVGAYLIAFNVSSWPISLVGTAVRAVAVPGFAQMRAGGANLVGAFWRGQLLLAAAGLPFAVLLATAPEAVITGLYGSQWAAGADALRLMGGLAIVRLLGGLVEDLLLAVGRSHWILWKNVVWILVLIPALMIGAWSNDLAGVGLAQTLVAAVVVAPLLVMILRHLDVLHGSWMRTIPALLPGAALAGAAGLLANHMVHAPALVKAAVVAAVVFVAYGLSLWPLRHRLVAAASR